MDGTGECGHEGAMNEAAIYSNGMQMDKSQVTWKEVVRGKRGPLMMVAVKEAMLYIMGL